VQCISFVTLENEVMSRARENAAFRSFREYRRPAMQLARRMPEHVRRSIWREMAEMKPHVEFMQQLQNAPNEKTQAVHNR
jgi:hypothetical protein